VSAPLVEHVLGNPDAPVTVVEFGDYECPFCAAAAPVLRRLVEDSGRYVRLVFRNFPLFEVHPYALTAALAAESTVASGAFWDMHALLFVRQDRLDDKSLRRYAGSVGADPGLATGDAAQAFAPKVQADYADALEAGVRQTPSLFINDNPWNGRVELDALRRATGGSPTGYRRPPR
jgi:protein-disulfide isomerase